MATACVASIDQGTSSTRVLIICSNGRILSSHQVEHTQHYPTSGQVEHEPLEIWKNVKICLSSALANVKEKVELVGIGITNQRETTVVWNKDTGAPYHRAIVWNDTRTGNICERLVDRFGSNEYFREKTGLPINSYFSATKIMYLLETLPGLREDAEKGKALFGTIDTWLIWKLTNGKVHATDVSNGARTMLMNLKTLQWDEEILHELNIPKAMLPAIHPSSHIYGHIDTMHRDDLDEQKIKDDASIKEYKHYQNIPISGVIGDQNAALFGQACFTKGDIKCTYGTGAFLLLNTGNVIVPSKKGLLTTVAYQLKPNPKDPTQHLPVYALEGSIAYSGSVIQWLRDNLQIISHASETETLASSVTDNGGVYFVPAFAGLYAPYWREDARGLIVGLTAYHTKAHIVRAALEASAYQTIELVEAMNSDSGASVPISSMKVDGGLTANHFLMQFQSDLLNIPLIKPRIAETTALGAAYMAGLGVGLWSSLDDIEQLWHSDNTWKPAMDVQYRSKLVYHWQKALARSMHWQDNATFDTSGDVIFDETHRLNEDPLVRHYYSTVGRGVKLPRTSSEIQRTTAMAVTTATTSAASVSTTSTGALNVVNAIGNGGGNTTVTAPLPTSTSTLQMVEKETKVVREVAGKVRTTTGGGGGGRWKSMVAGGVLLGVGFVAGVSFARGHW